MFMSFSVSMMHSLPYEFPCQGHQEEGASLIPNPSPTKPQCHPRQEACTSWHVYLKCILLYATMAFHTGDRRPTRMAGGGEYGGVLRMPPKSQGPMLFNREVGVSTPGEGGGVGKRAQWTGP